MFFESLFSARQGCNDQMEASDLKELLIEWRNQMGPLVFVSQRSVLQERDTRWHEGEKEGKLESVANLNTIRKLFYF